MNLATVQRAVLSELHDRKHWLLVFDNAENPQDVMPWLPGGSGHVLITSRARRWAEVAVPIEVDVLSRADSVAMLRSRVSAMSQDDADRVAEAVGDLPLAIAQAAGTMADTGMAAAEYNRLLTSHAAEMLDQGRPASYPRSLAAVTQLAFDQLQSEAPAAADLVWHLRVPGLGDDPRKLVPPRLRAPARPASRAGRRSCGLAEGLVSGRPSRASTRRP